MDDCKLMSVSDTMKKIAVHNHAGIIAGGLSMALLIGGCGNNEKSLWQQIKTLGGEKNTLAGRVEKLEQENEQLRRQALTLQGLDPNSRLTAVDTLKKIVIGRRSGFYDKDNDGKKETLTVYVEPTDSAEDRIKAAGRVNVQLWNLNAKDPQKALLKQWTVEPDQLRQCWVDTIMTYCYRLSFPTGDIIKGDETGLTIKVQFVDYFSGKTLEDQRAIK
jgi:outer membrane murein-binding lipoprotein Lpp